jgi:nitrogenase molybdenum-cofactor synthesis protein NifE
MDAEAAKLAADPDLAETARRARKICLCKTVDLGTIEDAIRAHGLTTVDAVKDATNASGGCRACTTRIKDILAAMPPPAVPMLDAAE